MQETVQVLICHVYHHIVSWNKIFVIRGWDSSFGSIEQDITYGPKSVAQGGRRRVTRESSPLDRQGDIVLYKLITFQIFGIWPISSISSTLGSCPSVFFSLWQFYEEGVNQLSSVADKILNKDGWQGLILCILAQVVLQKWLYQFPEHHIHTVLKLCVLSAIEGRTVYAHTFSWSNFSECMDHPGS